jgi:hypothetical protein
MFLITLSTSSLATCNASLVTRSRFADLIWRSESGRFCVLKEKPKKKGLLLFVLFLLQKDSRRFTDYLLRTCDLVVQRKDF